MKLQIKFQWDLQIIKHILGIHLAPMQTPPPETWGTMEKKGQDDSENQK